MFAPRLAFRVFDRASKTARGLAVLSTIGGVLGGSLLAAGAARAEPPTIYKWVDEHGVAHYTTDRGRIPAGIRDRVLQGTDSARHGDWLRRDVGDVDATDAAAADATAVREPAAFETDPTGAAAAAPAARLPDDGVEVPEESDGIHAVASEPDWSEAPGGEAEWAPSDLGDGEAVARTSSDGAPAPPIPRSESVPAPTAAEPPAAAEPSSEPAPEAPTRATAANRPVPPPPPPPLAADGAPVAVAEPERPRSATVEKPVGKRSTLESDSELPFEDPPAPAAVAAPAPRPLAPDEQAKLEQLDREIASLEGEIARDEETLMVLVSETESTDQNALVDDPRFREVAQRMPQLQADLERLRERRARIQPSVSIQ